MNVWQRPVNADWRSINLANWESRVPLHTGPDGYNLNSFDDPDFFSTELRYDLPKLGRLDGLDIVHLPRVVHAHQGQSSRCGPAQGGCFDDQAVAEPSEPQIVVVGLADVAELIELIARQRPRSNNLIDDALT